MTGKFAGVGRAARWLALLGAMAASGGAFAAQEGGVPMPALSGAVEWLNSPPLTRESLRGKVVLVYQLSAQSALCQCMGKKVRQRRAGGDWRAYA